MKLVKYLVFRSQDDQELKPKTWQHRDQFQGMVYCVGQTEKVGVLTGLPFPQIIPVFIILNYISQGNFMRERMRVGKPKISSLIFSFNKLMPPRCSEANDSHSYKRSFQKTWKQIAHFWTPGPLFFQLHHSDST